MQCTWIEKTQSIPVIPKGYILKQEHRQRPEYLIQQSTPEVLPVATERVGGDIFSLAHVGNLLACILLICLPYNFSFMC